MFKVDCVVNLGSTTKYRQRFLSDSDHIVLLFYVDLKYKMSTLTCIRMIYSNYDLSG